MKHQIIEGYIPKGFNFIFQLIENPNSDFYKCPFAIEKEKGEPGDWKDGMWPPEKIRITAEWV